jgi:hypothetical protein
MLGKSGLHQSVFAVDIGDHATLQGNINLNPKFHLLAHYWLTIGSFSEAVLIK